MTPKYTHYRIAPRRNAPHWAQFTVRECCDGIFNGLYDAVYITSSKIKLYPARGSGHLKVKCIYESALMYDEIYSCSV